MPKAVAVFVLLLKRLQELEDSCSPFLYYDGGLYETNSGVVATCGKLERKGIHRLTRRALN